MKTTIYYFTGTGNSLAAAKKIAAVLSDCELVPIAALQKTTGAVVPSTERVGIVCPVYDSGVPVIVKGFAERLDLSGTLYTFAVVTMGRIGISALHQLNGILKRNCRVTLNAAFAVEMPGNFPSVTRPPEGENRKKILMNAEVRLQEIAGKIAALENSRPRPDPVSAILKMLLYPGFVKKVHDRDVLFSVSGECTSCGTCAAICPVGNISLENHCPVWNHRCEWCCACLNFCPVEAIQLNFMSGTKGRGRYRHMDLSVGDMKIQQGGIPE